MYQDGSRVTNMSWQDAYIKCCWGSRGHKELSLFYNFDLSVISEHLILRLDLTFYFLSLALPDSFKHTHTHTHPSPCLWGCALKPVNLFHLSTLWLVHPHSTSLTISPAPGCSLILYPTKADNLSKTSLLYSISGSSYFFFSLSLSLSLRGGSSFESTLKRTHSEKVQNYIIREGKYCLTFALRGCLIHLTLVSLLTLFSLSLSHFLAPLLVRPTLPL